MTMTCLLLLLLYFFICFNIIYLFIIFFYFTYSFCKWNTALALLNGVGSTLYVYCWLVYVCCIGIRTTCPHVAVDPVMVGVVVAPRLVAVVWVATEVFRRCPTAIREIGVPFPSLSCPVNTSTAILLQAHVLRSLLIVVVVVVI